ncbi:substrate-binding domain-containing protein [Bradyrhizobium sp. BTAi1]|uniref:substrate-binding domain-containing protein n=1 Tax=Bradyrhizobium sp. (strain BTAi1 / ATCC BAA-1182) TaxID=288000 RepID=UPI00005DE6A1|nr:substrate-binding domain-containing protein [Bradyrhizobium sp. BTAi1]ABQ34734.1 monosaccharide ABC transporter substrate-binding protein, CUT2 family [Bradyrhizobium sp. BTAi1]
MVRLRSVIFAGAALLALASPVVADGLADAPAPFAKGGVRIAVVNFIGGGDWLQAFEAGTKRQADALKVDLRISEARQDPDAQRRLIEDAINQKVDGLIINNGKPEALKDVAQKALDAGIKVVAYDVNLDNPKIPQVEQSDADMARLVLDQAVKEQGKGLKGGVVYVAGFAPLDRRYAVWKEFGKTHGLEERAVWGVVNDSVPASVADQTKAVLRAHPEITAIFTPWDEFARGVKLAIDELGVGEKVKIYGVDISTSDIQAIIEPKSPWVATAATNASVVGEVSVRAVALLIAGQDPGHSVLVQPRLVTRAELVENNIKTIEDLAAKIPAFRTSDAATAPWIPQVK